MKFDIIIDSHCHWGPSLTMGTNVTTSEVKRQQEETGITHVAIMPFPSTAIADKEINVRLLAETKKISAFIPYHYIREDYDREHFDPIPKAYCGGKWHWMRGTQDSASNYEVLDGKKLSGLIDKLRRTGKPVIFEEELLFTERFVEMADDLPLIVPHLGLLGGNQVDFLRSFKGKRDVYFDTALASQDMMLRFVETVGSDRVLFGSDVPFGSMKSELSKVMALPIPDEDKENILYKNFVRLTKYKVDQAVGTDS
jgi:uncharacterized protein